MEAKATVGQVILEPAKVQALREYWEPRTHVERRGRTGTRVNYEVTVRTQEGTIQPEPSELIVIADSYMPANFGGTVYAKKGHIDPDTGEYVVKYEVTVYVD